MSSPETVHANNLCDAGGQFERSEVVFLCRYYCVDCKEELKKFHLFYWENVEINKGTLETKWQS